MRETPSLRLYPRSTLTQQYWRDNPRVADALALIVERTEAAEGEGYQLTADALSRRPQGLAMVLYSRPYPTRAVLQALMDCNYSVTERRIDGDTAAVLRDLNPDLVLVAINPDQAASLFEPDVVGQLSSRPVVAIVPDTVRDASRLLDAFALLILRDSDIVPMLGSQLRALARLDDATEDDEEETPSTARIRDLAVDFDRMRATYRDTVLDISPAAVSVLGFLMRQTGKIVSAEEMLHRALGRRYSESEGKMAARQYIRRIRRALAEAGADPDLLVNVRGFGYMLEPPTHDSSSSAGPDHFDIGPDDARGK